MQFDHLFWIGDLNYCIDRNQGKAKDEQFSKEENWSAVKKLIDDKDYNSILQYDQLHKSRERGSAWVGLKRLNKFCADL